MYDLVFKNQFGYYELKKQMSEVERNEFYSNKYFQNSQVYTKQYSDEEIKYFNIKLEEKKYVVDQLREEFKTVEKRKEFLDIGCGEGFALKYFNDKGYNVTGIDYSSYGCNQHNPDMCNRILFGNINEKLDKLIRKNYKFDIINLDNVLEHLFEPALTLEKCKQVSDDNTILCIKVPNDFSAVQEYLYNNRFVDSPYWVAMPDHISYFNKDGLMELTKSKGWTGVKFLCDTPIDFNLLNDNVNYIKNKTVGKSCYKAKIKIENLLHEISIDEVINLYEIMSNMGIGREIIGYFKLS